MKERHWIFSSNNIVTLDLLPLRFFLWNMHNSVHVYGIFSSEGSIWDPQLNLRHLYKSLLKSISTLALWYTARLKHELLWYAWTDSSFTQRPPRIKSPLTSGDVFRRAFHSWCGETGWSQHVKVSVPSKISDYNYCLFTAKLIMTLQSGNMTGHYGDFRKILQTVLRQPVIA